ncbi:MAG: hypothetical protein ACFE8O_06540, partial [Candidatus Hermodarchaeota archaeon]
MNRKPIILGFLVALFLFPFIFPEGITPSPILSEPKETPLSTTNSNQLISGFDSQIPVPEGPTNNQGEYEYLGSGNASQTSELTQSTNDSQMIIDLDSSGSETAFVRLPKQWIAYQTYTNVYDLFENRSWQSNGDFESGTYGSPGNPTSWTYSENGDPGAVANITGYYGAYGYGGSDGIRTRVDWFSGWTWSTDYYGAYYQTVDIQRANPSSIKLDFKCRMNSHQDGGALGRMVVLVRLIGDQTVERRLTWASIGTTGNWYDVSIDLGASDIAKLGLPGNVDIFLGISWTDSSDSWSTCRYSIDFDDVVFQVRAQPQPTQIGLQINGTAVTNIGYGAGALTFTGPPLPVANPTEDWINILNVFTTTSDNIDLTCDMTLFIRKTSQTKIAQQNSQVGSSFLCGNESITTFETWYYAYQPYGFEQYNLNLTKPSTWILDEALDPLGTDRTDFCETSTTLVQLNSSTLNDVYGWWKFTFNSTNRVSSITTNFDTFRISPGSPSTLTVEATLSVSSGQANLTLYDPSGSVVNESSQTVTSTTVNFPNIQFTDGTTYPTGVYTLCISYDDGDTYYITSAGFQSKTISVEHATSLTPDESDIWVTYADTGNFYPRVQFIDTDTNLPITGATVNGTVAGNPISFYASGGYYDAQIAKSLLDPGDYVLNIDANKTYFDSQSTSINLYIRGGTSLTSPESPGLTVPYDEVFTVQVKYWDTYNNTGVTGATITTAGWPSTVVTPTATAGWYNLTVDTTDKPSNGTYSLSIQANLNYYQNQTLVLTIVIREISTTITYTPPGSVPWDEDVVISFEYTVNDPDSQHDGTGLSGASITAQLDGIPLVEGINYSLSDLGGGQYTLTILSVSGVIDTVKSYALNIQVTPVDSKYSDATRTINFTVRALETSITYDPPQPTPWGEDQVITFYYTVDDPDSTHDGEGITGVTSLAGTTLDGSALLGGEYTLVDNGGGQYTLTILYSSARINNVKSYTLQLYVISPSSEYIGNNRQITFVVRALITQVTFDPIASTPWSEDVVVTFYYRVSDTASSLHGSGISGVTNITGSTLDGAPLLGGDYTLVDNGGGQYTLTILYSSGMINSITSYSLYVFVNTPDAQHENAAQTTSFTVRTLATQITYNPVIPVPWSENVVITFYYSVNDPASSQHGNGIAGVTDISGSTLDGTPLTGVDYTLVDNGGGQYTLTILYSSGLITSIKAYSLYIYVNSPDSQHDDANQTIGFSIRAIQTFVTYDAVSPTPYGEDVEIIFYYIVNDPTSSQDGTGIPGVTNITGSTLDGILLNLGEYSLVDNGDGQYTLTILYSSDLITSIKTYSLNLYVNSPDAQHEDTTQTISFIIRSLRTSISFDPIPQTPWGEDVVITFYYVINDLDSSNDGTGIPGVTSITDSTLDAVALNPGEYTLVENGGGQYTLTILYSSGIISSIKSYSLALHVDTPSAEYDSADRTTTFTVRQLGTKITYTPPLPTPWEQDVVIIVFYLVEDTSSDQHGNGIAGVTSITGSTLDGVPLIGGDFTLVDNGGGQYTLTLLYSSGKLSNIKTYTLELHFDAPAIQYADADQTITFNIRTLTTQVTIDPPSQTPWSDDVIITFYYRVSDLASIQHGNGITGVTNITGSTLDAVLLDPGDYTLVDNGGGQYTLTILYSSGDINTIESYTLFLYVNSPDTQHDDASQTITFDVRTLATEITYDPVIPVPWSEDVIIIFYYAVNDPSSSEHGTGIPGVTSITGSQLDGTPLLVTDYTLVDNGGGQYTLTLLYTSGKINNIKTYTLDINVAAPDSQHDDADETIAFTIRTIRTFVTYDAVSPTPYGEDVEIIFYYIVNDPTSSQDGTGIPGVTNITGSTLDAIALDPGDYTLVDDGGGQYTLTILFSSKISSVKLYSLILYVVSPDTEHEDTSQTISFRVRTLRTSISFDPIPQTPWGEDVVITFYYVINDLDSSNDGAGIPGATSITGSTLDAVELNPGEYTLVDESGGQYTLTILFSSGVISSIKSYSLALHVDAPSAEYNAANRTTSFTVRLLGTKITYTPPLPTPWEQDVVITVFYVVEDTSSAQHGNGITGVSSISGSTLDAIPLVPADYTLVDNGGGQYTLTILYSSGKLSSIKTYTLELHFDAPAVQYADASQTITFDIRALTTQLTIDPPSPTPWGDDVVITFYYRVSDLASIQHGNGITGLTDISGSTLNAVGLVGTDYTLVDEGAGQYTLTILNSSEKINTIQSYILYLYVNAPTSNYDDADRSGQFDVRSIVTLVSYTPSPPVPRGTDVVIVFNYRVNDPASSQHGTGITVVTSLAGSLLDGGALNLGDYILVENGVGQYTLTILFSSGRISSIKTYSLDLYVNSPDTQHDDATVNIGFEIRTIRTAITYDPVGSTAWGLDVVIVFNFIVDDSASGEDGNGITGVTSIAGTLLDGVALDPGDYTLVDNGGGQYTLTILYSSGKISTVKIYSLALHVVSPDAFHQDADQTIGFRIRNHYIASDIDPITTIPWQNNGSMVLRIDDDDDPGISFPDAALVAIRILGPTTLYIDSGNWTQWVENGLANDGIFTVTIDTTGWALGTHPLDVYVYTSASYENDTVYTAATVRALATSFTYQSPPVVAWGEDGILEVNYTVSDATSILNGDPILGATISIATLTLGVDFSYLDNGDGTYTITIFAAELPNNQTYFFDISISSPAQYNNGALTNVPITVRALFTTLAYSRVPTTPYGDNVTVDVQYFILDGQSSNNGAFISGATITVTGIGGLTLLPSDYSVTPYPGYYRITITKTLSIGSYEIEVAAYHPTDPYRSARIANPPMAFNIRTVYTEIEKEPVDAAPYGEDFSITITYRVRDDASSQDGDGITGSDQITIFTNGSWANPSYSLFDLGNGQYLIIINSDQTPSPGSYWINVTLGWIDDPPTYEEQWVGVWLTSDYRETRIINSNPPDTNYADNVIVYLNYTDVLDDWGIDNTTTGSYVRIRILHAANDSEISATYYIEDITFGAGWSEPTLYYRVLINASELGAVNVIFNLKIETSWVAGNVPFYTIATKAFSVRTVGTETILYSETIQTEPTGDDIIINLHYETTGGGKVTNGTGYVGILVECDDIAGWNDSYWYVPASSWPGTDGNYTLIIRGSMNLDVGTYSFRITLTWPTGFDPQYFPYYASAEAFVSARVREIRTTLDWSQPSTLYYSQWLVIEALFQDRDHEFENITDVIWSIDVVLTFNYTQRVDETWVIMIDTTGLTAGAFSFYLTATKTNYEEQTRDVDITIHKAPLSLVKIDPTGSNIIVYWGELIPVTVYLEDALTGTPMTPANGTEIIYKWYNEDWKLMTYAGTPGFYTISPTLDTGLAEATGTQLIIQTNMTDYETEFFIFTVSIQAVNTRLDIPPGNSTAIQVYIEDNITLFVTFWSVYENGTFWNFLNNAKIRALNASTSDVLKNFTFIADGTYYCEFDTSDWRIQPQTITVTAGAVNTIPQQITFTITVRYKPCEIIVEQPAYSANYTENVVINIFLNDTREASQWNPIDGHSLYLIWQGNPYYFNPNGTAGWYYCSFPANATPSTQARTISIYHPIYLKYSDSSTSVPLTISKAATKLQLISAYSQVTIDGIEYMISVPFSNPSWFIPIGDTLVLTFDYKDMSNNSLLEEEVLSKYVEFYAIEEFDFDSISGYWTVHFQFSTTASSELRIRFTSDYYVDQTIIKSLEVGLIPMELNLVSAVPNLVYVGTTYSFALYLNDTYHNAPVSGADVTYELEDPIGADIQILPDPLHPGYYNITISANSVSSTTLTFTADKFNYGLINEIESFVSIQLTEFMRDLIFYGSIGAVVVVIALIGWILWARVYSIPWEVRRLRKLAKAVEKDENYKLGRKDLKRFHAREATMESKIDMAMGTIGVAATPAMIPRTEEVEEVTATEEDIMTELDKIPGLGPEEKTVLANEMRKIPRKDRIWFLDDLKRQMGQRRMDFLTQREQPITPPPEPAPKEAPPKPAPVEKPPVKPEAPPLEEVAPTEPP